MKRQGTAGWSVELSRTWDVLGPFPIHAREQQYLSPSFPLNLSERIDYDKQWPSSYADGGLVGWNTTQADENGQLKVSFPAVRWGSLRAYEGWAALQHHAVLKSTLTVYPPEAETSTLPSLLVNLIQGSYFTILPSGSKDVVPHWYAGNIYAMERALPQVVPLPSSPSTLYPTTYDIFVAGDYEIRLFGDPTVQGSDIPVQTITMNIQFDDHTKGVVHESTQDVVCDFVDGYAFGRAIGIGFRSVSSWWTVTSVKAMGGAAQNLLLELLRPTRIAPGQSRLVPIRLIQKAPFFLNALELNVTLTSEEFTTVVSVSLSVLQYTIWNETSFEPLKASYFYANSTPTNFGVVPPRMENPADGPKPVILALHGAGVDVVTSPFWARALPRNDYSWFVLPSGRTSWGLDWHGSSTRDAWESVDALGDILEGNSMWRLWKTRTNFPVLLMGHSNGGQGTWHIAARHPDRVIGVVPASAFVKSQQYVPLTLSRSAHFIDPTLRAILESSLTPDDNDLFLSNLAHTPVLAIHGGVDENVPVWHGRELISALKTWNPNTTASLREDPGQGHWFDTVLNNDEVITFVQEVLDSPLGAVPLAFTLTVAVPAESGSLAGWRISALRIPGRLGRLVVQRADGEDAVQVATSNVEAFSVNLEKYPFRSIRIDGTNFDITTTGKEIHFQAVESKIWKIRSSSTAIQPSGRIQSILSSSGPLVLVVSDENDPHELSIALRISQDLNTYHKLDAEIVRSSEVSNEGILSQGNVIIIGNDASAPFVGQPGGTSIGVSEEQIVMNGQPQPSLAQPGLGILFLHPHPTLPTGKMLFLQSTDAAGLEKAAKLFPIRTGIAVPDWIVIGPRADKVGAAGVMAAGVWGNGWSWNEAMSWSS